jgi:branched-subunit amino acid transport protein
LIQDKDSMLRLVQVIDQALGYVPPSLTTALPGGGGGWECGGE